MFITQLHLALSRVAPIDGVSLGSTKDKTTWRIDFAPDATLVQRAAAKAIMDAFDVVFEELKLKNAEQFRENKKAILLTQPNKSVTVQDLTDLGIL